ncbi:unnamed protein product [Closterium sp. NIES-54]
MVCARALKQQQGQPQRQQLQHSRQWGPEAASTTSLAPAFVAGLGATSQTAQLSFTLDPGASSCFFRDSTDLTPLRTPVTVALADPSVGPIVARSTTTLPCPAAPSGFLTGYYTPSFSRNHGSLTDPAVGCLGPLPSPWPTSEALLPDCGGRLLPLHHGFPLETEGRRAYRLRVVATSVGWCPGPLWAPPTLGPWCAPQFLWPQAVRYAVHQLNLWPSDARPRVTPISLWTGSPSVVADFRVWGSLAHVRAPNANKLSPRIRACVFLGFLLDASGWVFYDPITYEFFASQDVRFEEFVCYYRSRPHRVAPPPPAASSPVLSGGAGGAVAEGEGTGCAGAGGVGSGGAGVPSRSSLRPVTGGLGGVGGGGAGSGGDGAGGTGTVAPTPRTARFLTREQHLLQLEREERERFERAQQQQQLQQEQCQSQSQQ